MRREHLRYLACPGCKAPFEVVGVSEEDQRGVRTGQLRCSECSVDYPIVRYVPRFVPPDNYASGFGLQWTKHARTQYDNHTGVPISETRFFTETRWPRDLKGEIILEVGSGSGRFTLHAASTGAMVVSIDYSNAVDVNETSNGDRFNVLVVQGDVYRMPFPAASFDRALCIGVLQHTPDVRAAFRAVVDAVKPGGHVTIDVYKKPSGMRRFIATKYWVRPLTRRIRPALLYRLTRAYVSLVWPLWRLISRIPRIGKKLNWMLLVADYRGVYAMSDTHLREWAILDTFDMLGPVYDRPQSLDTVQQWFVEAGLSEIDVHYGYNGIEGRGRRPLP